MNKKVFQLTLLLGCMLGSTSLTADAKDDCRGKCVFREGECMGAETDQETIDYCEANQDNCMKSCEGLHQAAPRAKTMGSKPKIQKPTAKTPTPTPTLRK